MATFHRRQLGKTTAGSTSLDIHTCIPAIPLIDDHGVEVLFKNCTIIGTMFQRLVVVYTAQKKVNAQAPIENVNIMYHRDPESIYRLKREYARSALLNGEHPNILKATGKYTTLCGAYFCVEIPCVDESLRTAMMARYPKGLVEASLITVVVEVLKGLNFLHAAGHIHGELKSNRIYLKNDNGQVSVKLGYASYGFDFKCELPSPDYVPDEHYTGKSDIWMIGILCLELSYGSLSFKDAKNLDSFVKRVVKTKKFPSREILKEYEKGGLGYMSKVRAKLDVFQDHRADISPAFSAMVAQCLNPRPSKRPTAASLLEHEVFKRPTRSFHGSLLGLRIGR